MTLDAVLFYVSGALVLLSALVVVGQRNPMYSAFALIATLISLSVVFGLLGSTFIAVLQVVVYAGAIMVLFLFVLMLLSVKREERIEGQSGALKATGAGLGALLAGQMAVVLVRSARGPEDWPAAFNASSRRVAEVLFSAQYAYVFELTSVLILAALVGALALAKRDL
jgi:NADH-quinone oxidoreductase subunit J